MDQIARQFKDCGGPGSGSVLRGGEPTLFDGIRKLDRIQARQGRRMRPDPAHHPAGAQRHD